MNAAHGRSREAVGTALARCGIGAVFGVVGSGNFRGDQRDGRARAPGYVAARHEGGAATMADAYARMSGGVAALSLHQGCGLTNALTGITEAAKSRTPLVVVAAEATSPAVELLRRPAGAGRGGRGGADAGHVGRDARSSRRPRRSRPRGTSGGSSC